MGRKKAEDPKVPVTLSIRRSTVERIRELTPPHYPSGRPRSVGSVLSEAVEAKYGRGDG